jgi:Ca2+/Na+ antiporter
MAGAVGAVGRRDLIERVARADEPLHAHAALSRQHRHHHRLHLHRRPGLPFLDHADSIIGQFLVLVQLVKLYEQRANRDWAQLIILNLLLMVAAAINTASLVFGLMFIAYLFLSLYVCLLFHLRSRAKRTGDRAAGIEPNPALPAGSTTSPAPCAAHGADLLRRRSDGRQHLPLLPAAPGESPRPLQFKASALDGLLRVDQLQQVAITQNTAHVADVRSSRTASS